MIFRQRQPCAPLSKFIDGYWFYQDLAVEHAKEKLLPNGAIELIIDLSPMPKKLYDPLDLTRFTTYRRAWISGMQRRYMVMGAEPAPSREGALSALGGWPFLPLRELAARIGVSQKKMISRFDSRVGCTPKLAARIFRFQRALEVAYRAKDHDWAEVAQQCGYYDQSHFIHEFQEFAGMTAPKHAPRGTG